MSTFKPTKFDSDINVTKEHPLKETAWLIGNVCLVIVGIYVILNIVLVFLISHVSVQTEMKIWQSLQLANVYQTDSVEGYTEKQTYLQNLLDKLPSDIKPEGYDFKIYITEEEDINAHALPAGHIQLTKGLVDKIDNENALAFIIGHELGHFKNRDHLKSLGRLGGTLIMSAALMGQTGEASQFVSGLVSLTDMAHSRQDEKEADLWGIQTLQLHYGHSGGAADLFEISQEENSFELPDILSTHPLDQKRIKHMQDIINSKGYRIDETLSLPWKTVITEEDGEGTIYQKHKDSQE